MRTRCPTPAPMARRVPRPARPPAEARGARGLVAGLGAAWMLAAGFCLTACGAAPEAGLWAPETNLQRSAIVAGTRCQANDYPATGVILYYSDDPNSPMGAMICSGTLVATDVVLAAGHCQERFEQEQGRRPQVRYYFSLALDVSRFGPLVPHLPSDAVPVSHFLPHPDYAREPPSSGLGRSADLGLFFLAAPITSVAPAALASWAQGDALVAGAQVTIVGYGRRLVSALGSQDNGIKYQGLSTIRAVGPYEMHVGSGHHDALKCHGDSGGPTYMQLSGAAGGEATLVGITSRALDWAGCLAGGVDTRVDAYLPWIENSFAWACGQGLRPSCRASATAAND